MVDALRNLAEQVSARVRGEEPQKKSLLDTLQGTLDHPDLDPALQKLTTTDLNRKLITLRNFTGRLPDEGAKNRVQCQQIEAILKLREGSVAEEPSKRWRKAAAENQAEANLAGAGHANQRPIPSSYPQTELSQKNERLRKNRDFCGDDAPSTSQGWPPAPTRLGVQSSQRKPKTGPGKTLSSAVNGLANYCCLPIQVSSRPTKQDASRRICNYCEASFPVKDLRWQKVQEEDGMQSVCATCWGKIQGDKPWPEMDALQTSTIKHLALPAQDRRPVLQAAPLKSGKASQSVCHEQSSQNQGSKKVSVRQNTRMQKQQKQKQDDNEPICIDSDEDDHAAGSVPARESDHNGAGPALRRSERSNITKTTVQTFQDMRCVYPLGRKLDVVEMTEHDLSRLDRDEFLNDTVIDFFAKYIQEHLDSDNVLKFHFFNTFFFKKLTEKSTVRKSLSGNPGREGTPDSDTLKALSPAQRNHLRVKSWTKGVDIFSKDFLLIPIHDALHWSLIIVCHPGLDFESSERRPYILHLDSMEGSCHSLPAISKAIRTYLDLEWQRKIDEQDSTVPGSWANDHPGAKHIFNGTTMPGKTAHVPRQDNYCDCGLFVLAYMDFWTHTPPNQVELCEKGVWKGDMPYPAFLSKHWFQYENASALRKHIRNLILDLFRQQKRLPDDHPSMLAAVLDMDDYREGPERKYRSPADYLTDAAVADKKRREETVKRAERMKEDKAQKDAEAAERQAEAKRKAGEKAEERKRKQEAVSQGDDFEVNLTDSGGSAHEHSPDISVPPAFVTEHQPKIEEVSNKRRRKRRSQDETAQSATDVQDLTESPVGEASMHLRSGGTKVHAGPGSPADADVPATRRSSRHRSSSAKYRLETSDEEADAQPPAKRQLALLDTGQAPPQSGYQVGRDGEMAILVPETQPDEPQPGMHCQKPRRVLHQCTVNPIAPAACSEETCTLTAETQHQSDHIIAQQESANLVEEADRCQSVQLQQDSGFDDDAELIEPEVQESWGIHSDDRLQQLQQSGKSHQPAVAASSGQWHSALLTSEHEDTTRQRALSSLQLGHHDNSKNAHQQQPAQTSHPHQTSPPHQTSRPFPLVFQNTSHCPPADDGYKSIQAVQSFSSKMQTAFGGLVQNHVRHLLPSRDQEQVPIQDPSTAAGYSHDSTKSSPETDSDPPILQPHPAAGSHQSPLCPAVIQAAPHPFPDPPSALKSSIGISDPHFSSGYGAAQHDYPPPDVAQAQQPEPLWQRLNGKQQPPAIQAAEAGVCNTSGRLRSTTLSEGPTPQHQAAADQVVAAGPDGATTRAVSQPNSPGANSHLRHQLHANQDAAPHVGSPSQGVRAGRRAAKSHQHREMPLARSAGPSGNPASVLDPLGTLSLIRVPDPTPVRSPAAKRAKLSPPSGLLSPPKSFGAQWPAEASALQLHGQPAARLSGALPSDSKPAKIADNGGCAVINSGRPESHLLQLDLEQSGVLNLFDGHETPSGRGSQSASQPPEGSKRAYLHTHCGVVAHTEEDARQVIGRMQASAAAATAAQGSINCDKQVDLIEIDGHDSVQCLRKAEVSGAQLADKLKQHQVAQGQQSALAGAGAEPGAIDISGDDELPDNPDMSDVSTSRWQVGLDAQAVRDKQYAKEQQLVDDEHIARDLDLQERQNRANMHGMSLQDPLSDSNDRDWDPSMHAGKPSRPSGSRNNGKRNSKQTKGRDPGQSTLHFSAGVYGTR